MFPITVYDEKTVTFRPIWDGAVKAALVMGIEWSSLTLIEDAPRYVKFATFFLSISALAVWQNRPWLYRRWHWWFPILMWPLVLAFIGVWTYAYIEFPAAPASSPAPAAPPQTGGFGFVPSSTNVPSKPYSEKEKRALLDLIGIISEELNDKGLPAARLAQTTGGNLVTPSKDGLNDAFVRGNSVIKTLSNIQRVIWNEILQPNNSNFLADLNYVVDNNAKFDQFQRATDRFTGTIENFQRNLDSFGVDQRNWISGLIQIGSGQVWNQSADEFQAWIQQCNSRMDKERDGLK